MVKRVLTAILVVAALSGCVSTQYAQVVQGPVVFEGMSLTATDALWNRAPGVFTGFLHPGSEMWTRDGLLLDRLLLINAIGNSQALFKSNDPDNPFPLYRNGMLPNEIAELTVASLTKLFGGGALIESGKLRPQRVGQQRRAMFDLTVVSSEGANLSGRALTFIANDQLYLLVYLAAEIHYFDKHWPQVESLFESIQV